MPEVALQIAGHRNTTWKEHRCTPGEALYMYEVGKVCIEETVVS